MLILHLRTNKHCQSFSKTDTRMTAIVLKQDPNTETFKKNNAIYYDNTQRTLLRFVRIDSVFCCCCFFVVVVVFVCLFAF